MTNHPGLSDNVLVLALKVLHSEGHPILGRAGPLVILRVEFPTMCFCFNVFLVIQGIRLAFHFPFLTPLTFPSYHLLVGVLSKWVWEEVKE